MLAVLGIPVLDACKGDDRGLVTCLRGVVDHKFDLGLEPRLIAEPEALPVANPITAETPVPAGTVPEVQVADMSPDSAAAEPVRSLVPEVAEKPVTPAPAPPQVVATPQVADVPNVPPVAPAPVGVPGVPVAEAPVVAAEPPETVALASVIEPASQPAQAPSFVPALPVVTVDGVPPDLRVAVVVPDAVPPPEPAPGFALPSTPQIPPGPPPDLLGAAAEPAAVVEPAPAPAPAFVLPAPTGLPTSPPPDLTVAAIDPVIPADTPEPAVPVLGPSIDAVEIDGDANFIAGNGPAGAMMRLYVDGIPAGVSPVEGGRWLVEGTDLLTEEQQLLKVEALDPLTGKLLGEATIIFEGPVEPAAAELVPAGEPVADPEAPALEPEPSVSQPEATEQREVPIEEPAALVQPEARVEEPAPASIPEIAAVVPSGESPSVTIFRPAQGPEITTLATGGVSADAVVTLGTAPAIIAHFTLPRPEIAADVTVLRAIPIGDPGAGRFVSGEAIIRRGDTLWDIAHRYYGHGVRYRTIVRANRDLIARPGKIYPGQVLTLPLVYDD